MTHKAEHQTSSAANPAPSTHNPNPENPAPSAAPDPLLSHSICSATDCTGLIPALPDSDAELEAYEEMYEFCLRK